VTTDREPAMNLARSKDEWLAARKTLLAYQYLDLVPRGRDEDALDFPMAWLRRRDEYER
jgi:predicted dithiol-disulfide oxidoreductase (DUF899 family)